MKRISSFLIALIFVFWAVSVSAATVYPFTGGLTGGGTGALDKRTGTIDKDGAIVILNDNGTYGNAAFTFSLDAVGGCGSESAPTCIESGDAGEWWELTDWYMMDLHVIGDDIFATTNTAGYLWIGDGTNYNPVAPAAPNNGDTTHYSTAGQIYTFCETTQAYLQPTDVDTWAELPALANGYVLIGNGTSDATATVLADTTSNGIDTTATPGTTLSWAIDTTEINTKTWGDGSGATIGWTFNVQTGTDPVFTFGNNYINVSTGDLQVGGSSVAVSTGDTYTGAHDFGGATSVEIPNGTDPDVDAAGEISQDTDGANESGDVSWRAYDGSNQVAIARKLKCINVTVVNPQDLDDAQRDLFPVWDNNTGMVFTITEIKAWSDTDDTTLNVEVVTATNWSSPTLVDALEIATNGTSVYTDTQTTISDPTIAHDEIITLDFDDTDDPGVVKVSICGWLNANID